MFFQLLIETGLAQLHVVPEGRVRVDLGIGAFVNMDGVVHADQISVEISAGCLLNAVGRPEDLFDRVGEIRGTDEEKRVQETSVIRTDLTRERRDRTRESRAFLRDLTGRVFSDAGFRRRRCDSTDANRKCKQRHRN